MRVSLYVGTTEYVLAHGSAHGVDLHVGPSADMRSNIRSVSQVDQIIGAVAVTIADRGNRQGSFVFSVEVMKSTLDAAAFYALTYGYLLPRAGTIRIVEGTTTKNLTGYIDDVTAIQHGVSITLTYTITFGVVS